MAEELRLESPWLIAVWPGMGHVALNAGIYLLAKLGMQVVAELEAEDLFDVGHIEVTDGIIQPMRGPRNRFFAWRDPGQKHDLLVFLGEAQPPLGKYPLCRQLIAYAKDQSVERVFTFAAMATQMPLGQRSKVFAAATDEESLAELKRLGLDALEDGHVSGLNGVLLGAAVESGLPGACLLGEMPHVFSELSFPKASLAILEVFAPMAKIDLDLTELTEQARETEERLEELLARAEQEQDEEEDLAEEAGHTPEPVEEEQLRESDRQRIERLFDRAGQDRSKAFELKQELDRLDVFKDYEDRFLDLFKAPREV
jgi:uncharacterized protein